MEDYIFILIAILLSVFGAINRKKKREEGSAAEEPTPAGRRPSAFDELFGDPLFREEETPPRPVVKPAVISKPVVPPVRKKSPAAPPGTVPVRKVVALQEQQQKRKVHPLMENFSMKKAVIYSEILQRKF
ncbi:MAG: hypothetical protein AB7V25_17920 [Mangrovibacterium sp.]